MRDPVPESSCEFTPGIADLQKLCQIINVYCFNLLNFRVFFYTAMENTVGALILWALLFKNKKSRTENQNMGIRYEIGEAHVI